MVWVGVLLLGKTASPEFSADWDRHVVSGWFAAHGIVVATWVAHIPRLKGELDTTTGPMGLALLGTALGSILGMILAPRMMIRIGAPAASQISGWASAAIVPAPLLSDSVAMLGLTLIVFGMALGANSVAINSAAIGVERRLGRAVMSGFHGWFSVGMLLGSLFGIIAFRIEMAPLLHASVGIILAIGAFWEIGSSTRGTDPTRVDLRGERAKPSEGYLKTIARYPAILALGAMAFACLLAEGSMADWAGVLMEDLGSYPALAPSAFAAYSLAMAAMRFLGDRLTERIGDLPLLIASSAVAGFGLAAGLILGHPLSFAIGAGLVGLGLANAVPTLYRHAADVDPSAQTSETSLSLSLVTATGFTGFLVGPPLIGWLGEQVTLRWAMLVPAGCCLILCGGVSLWHITQDHSRTNS